jgi:hypothetical protein
MKVGHFKLWKNLQGWADYKAMCYWGDLNDGGPPMKATRIGFVIWWLREFRRVSHCWLRGHDPEDQGYANPECGCIDMVCRRCGAGLGKHWLY